jgi:hypothetical protein
MKFFIAVIKFVSFLNDNADDKSKKLLLVKD